jgi:hypothetical protein
MSDDDGNKLALERWHKQMADEEKEIRELTAALKAYPGPEHAKQRASWARCLNDLFGTRREVTFMTEVLEDLVYRAIPTETDNLARAELFGAVETALGKNPSVDIPLDGLVAKIGDDNPAWTANVLLLLARWGHRKHLPLVKACLTHANEHIRANAEYAWKHHYKNFADEATSDGT